MPLSRDSNDLEESVLIVDPQKSMNGATGKALQSCGILVRNVGEEKSALQEISLKWPGILVIYNDPSTGEGLEFLDKVRQIDQDLPVLMILGHGDIPLVVSAMRKGAYDVIKKPFSHQDISEIILGALEKRRGVLENRRHQSEFMRKKTFLAGVQRQSRHMEALFETIRRVGEVDTEVLIMGEMGTGKKMVARCLHDQSPREHKKFITVDCSDYHEETLEIDLFGRESGGFPGTQHHITGKIEDAKGGTLFLDKIDRLPKSLQDKLLQVLQEGTLKRPGSNEPMPIDIRVIAATQEDLKKACAAGTFREDLYCRLNGISMALPSLREHREDISLLFQHFVHQACALYQLPTPLITIEIYQELLRRDWPGNVHELKNFAERWILGYDHDLVSSKPSSDIEGPNGQVMEDKQSLAEKIKMYEKILITHELTRSKGNAKTTYAALGLPRKTFYDKLNKHGLRRKDFVESSPFNIRSGAQK